MSVTDVKACVRVVNVYWFQYIFSYDFFRLPSYFFIFIYIRATWNDDGKNVEINVYVILLCASKVFSACSLFVFILIISNVLWDRIYTVYRFVRIRCSLKPLLLFDYIFTSFLLGMMPAYVFYIFRNETTILACNTFILS